MMKKNLYKAVIVGAGPAGLSAALNLLKSGVEDILVLERFTFPRYKCCAGYITNKTRLAYYNLGLNIDSCNYSLIKDFKIVYKFRTRLTILNKFLYTNKKIDRVELDYAFFKLAKSKGIEILEGIKIVSHAPENNTLTLSDGSEILYQNLIFADGTSGFGCRYQNTKKKNIALQLTFQSDKAEEIEIHFGKTKRGYGWVASFDGTTNVGLTDVYNPEINYLKVFKEFLDELNIQADTRDLKGAFTPIGVGKSDIFGNVFFVGDAVGACDPLTLSGLRYGLKSGEMCAKAIVGGKNNVYKKYINGLKFKFNFMKIFQSFFYLPPVLCFGFCILCRFFGKLVSRIFNNFFVNKK